MSIYQNNIIYFFDEDSGLILFKATLDKIPIIGNLLIGFPRLIDQKWEGGAEFWYKDRRYNTNDLTTINAILFDKHSSFEIKDKILYLNIEEKGIYFKIETNIIQSFLKKAKANKP